MPKPGRKFLVRIALFAALAIAATYQYRKYKIAPELPLEAFSVETLDGEPITILPGQDGALIVKFFATWCIDCRREIPKLKANAGLFKRYNVRLILLSDEARYDISFFANREALPFPVYRLPKKLKEYGIFTLPTTYVYKKTGVCKWKYTGSKEITEEVLKDL